MLRTTRRALFSVAVLLAGSGCKSDDKATSGAGKDAPAPTPAITIEPATLVLKNTKVVTVDDANPQAQAVAVRGDRIVAVGKNDDVARFVGPDTRVLDLAGKLVIPGFIEGHGHFLSLGDRKLQLDLREAGAWNDIVEQVGRAAKEAPAGTWIRGRGWHQEKWSEPPAGAVEGSPVHTTLSAASPNHPVFLVHASGHAAFVNAKAMELAGIDETTQDPPGGAIVHDKRGKPTGMLRERAAELVAAVMTGGDDEVALDRKRVEHAQKECFANGITSFQDAGSSFRQIDLFKQLADEGDLKIRLWAMVREPNEALAAKLGDYKLIGHANHHLTVRAIKRAIDGALGSHGAWLLEPYTDAPESSGLNTIPVPELTETAQLAKSHGFQLCVHAIGDRGNRETLDVFESVLGDAASSDHRWRVEHAQHLHPDEVPRFAKLGAIASMQGIHCTSDAPWVVPRLGEKRASEGAYVWRKLIESGAVVTNGTDAPVEDVSPLASYYATVTRKLADGSTFYPDQSLSREVALRTYTLNPAFAAFEDGVKGSLAAGKLADITVLDRDILTIPEDQILKAQVVYTIVGGEIVYQSGTAG